MRTVWHLLPVVLLLGCTETQLVPPEPVAHLDVGADSLVMSPGETLRVTVVPRDLAGNELYDRVIGLTLSSTSIATIDSQGTLAGVAVGSAQLRLSSEGALDSVPVRVVTSWVGGSLGDASYGPGCLLRPDRRAWCFGPYVGGSIPTPRISTVAFRTIDGGYMHICGIAADSTGWCWGFNGDGGILNATYQGSAPEPTEQIPGAKFRSLSPGYEHTCGVLSDGTGLCWGHNDEGQLGDSLGYSITWPDTVHGGHVWKAIGAGDHWSCGLDSAGAPWCWGYNAAITAFNNTAYVPIAIGGAPALESIEVGGDFACGLTAAGAAWCWGENDVGQLGRSGGPGPGQVVTSVVFSSLTIGYNEACGLDAGGVAWCWGHGGYTGDGTWENHKEPIAVAGGHRFAALGGGWPGFCGFTSGGAAWCWGDMNFWSTHALVPRRVWDP